jgi:hypothetical protein
LVGFGYFLSHGFDLALSLFGIDATTEEFRCPLGVSVHLRPAALLEERSKAAGDLSHRLRIRQRKALVAGERGSIQQDMKEIGTVRKRSRLLYG